MQTLAELVTSFLPEPMDGPQIVWTEKLAVDLPLQLEVSRERRGLRLTAKPMQTFVTGLMPSMHRGRFDLTVDEEPDR
jgi:hypothetical protein